MKPLDKLVRSADGSVNLHLWREGEEYIQQKGPIFLEQWNNIVFRAQPGKPLPNTRYLDLSTSPLGYPDATFDAVYAYHVFEHLPPSHGERCVRQLFSVLKPGGILRLSVPDLETACRDYLQMLDIADREPTPQNLVRYRWAVMTIFEQMVRDRSGGLMLDALRRGEYDPAQIQDIFGDALRSVIARARSTSPGGAADGRPADARDRSGLSSFTGFLRNVYRAARAAAGRSSGNRYGQLDPRLTKEAGQWMYDRLSLRLLVESAGFEDVRQVDYVSSSIPGWSSYDFDRAHYGDYPFDPSVYIEGRKPSL